MRAYEFAGVVGKLVTIEASDGAHFGVLDTVRDAHDGDGWWVIFSLWDPRKAAWDVGDLEEVTVDAGGIPPAMIIRNRVGA